MDLAATACGALACGSYELWSYEFFIDFQLITHNSQLMVYFIPSGIMKILITGSAGFIGFHAAQEFLRRSREGQTLVIRSM